MLLSQPACAQTAASAPAPKLGTPILILDDKAQTPVLNAALEFMLDTDHYHTVEQVETLPEDQFTPLAKGKLPRLDGNGALWLRFDAVIKTPDTHWRLALPLPGVDEVSVYFRDSEGQWIRQQAGDIHPISNWPLAGRYPVFSLSSEMGQPVRYYIHIRHARVPFSTPLRLITDSQLIYTRQTEHMLLGIYFGLAALVIGLAVVYAAAYRDLGFASYAVYVIMFAGSQGVFTGIAGLYWWPELPALNNAAVIFLPVSAAAAAMWFVRTVTTPRRFSRALDWLILALMAVLPLIGLLDVAYPTVESFSMINTLISVSMLVLLVALVAALAEGDRHARWMAMGFLPVLIATLFPLMRNLGVISSSFWTEYALILGSAIEVPVLFYGLHRRVSQRREPGTRATTLRTTDALTGLHSAKVLVSKLRQALGTAERYQQPFALLMVNLANLASLQNQHGRQTGEHALVMAAARIRAVARPADTVARAGEAQFALLIEGPISADAANDVATKIIASGLRPSNELPESESLRFHIAVGHLGETAGVVPAECDTYLARMLQAVKEMNDGSRKAIRLVRL
ncbi:MAG: 7TM diverse intracellular signaling domain-containing protein [Pseudomonadota bacterium]